MAIGWEVLGGSQSLGSGAAPGSSAFSNALTALHILQAGDDPDSALPPPPPANSQVPPWVIN